MQPLQMAFSTIHPIQFGTRRAGVGDIPKILKTFPQHGTLKPVLKNGSGLETVHYDGQKVTFIFPDRTQRHGMEYHKVVTDTFGLILEAKTGVHGSFIASRQVDITREPLVGAKNLDIIKAVNRTRQFVQTLLAHPDTLLKATFIPD